MSDQKHKTDSGIIIGRGGRSNSPQAPSAKPVGFNSYVKQQHPIENFKVNEKPELNPEQQASILGNKLDTLLIYWLGKQKNYWIS